LANGGAKFTREWAGQNTLLSRTNHGFAYDSVRDEVVIPHKLASAILTFNASTSGDVPPVRKIFGPNTQLENNSVLTLDPVHGEIFVPQPNSILVFDRDSNGDVPPIRVIKGPDTMLRGNGNLQVDPVHNVIVASGFGRGGGDGEGGGGQVLIFDRMANGNAKPLRVITHPTVGLVLASYPPKGWIFSRMVKTTPRKGPEDDGRETYIGVWNVNDNGNTPPHFTIGGPSQATATRRPHGITVDGKNKSVVISDNDLNAIFTYEVPELFE
jgi:hypothetical protein